MKQYIFLLIWLFLFYNYNQILGNENNLDSFNQIIIVSQEYEKLINANLDNSTYLDYISYFCLVSENFNEYKSYLDWFEDLKTKILNELKLKYQTIELSSLNVEQQNVIAENLLLLIHKYFFKRYNAYASTIRDIYEKGEYNCVSSSIIYAIFLKRLGYQYVAVETKDHVFIKLIFPDFDIDVETTNLYGFDPGKKKEVLNDFGKITGFSYVPPKDYRNRNNIDFKKLLLLVSHNLANQYYTSGNPLKAVNLAYLIYQGRQDNKGKEDFFSFFNNYIANLAVKKQYIIAINNINRFLKEIEWNDNLVNLRFNLLNNWVVDLIIGKNILEAKQFLFNQNDQLGNLINDKRFIEIYFYFIYKVINKLLLDDKFDEAYQWVKEFDSLYKYKDSEKLVLNILKTQIEKNEQNERDNSVIFSEVILNFPDYQTSILKYEKNYLYNRINQFIIKQNYLKALNEADISVKKYPEDENLKLAYKNAYVKYTVYLFEKRDLNAVISYSEEALKVFPNETTIKNNYLAFLNNFIKEAIDKNNLAEARKIYEIAIEKFPGDNYLLKIDLYLQSKKY